MSSGEDTKTAGGGIGCGSFYLAGQGLYLINTVISRRRSVKNAHFDAEFEEEMRGRKEDYADNKSERDLAFSRTKYEQKRQFRREEAKAKLVHDLETDDLKMFFSDWPLALDIHAILKNPSLFSGRMNFILARKAAERAGDPVATCYGTIVERVKKNVNALGIGDDQVLVYREGAKRVGWPAVANIFAMMQSFPVIIIIPDILPGERGTLSFSVSLWTKDSSFPMNRRLFSIDYNEMKMRNDAGYQKNKLSDVVMAETVIAGVLHDCYQITLAPETEGARFPAVARELGVERYPAFLDFMLQEYDAIGSPERTLSAFSEHDISQLDESLRARLDLMAQRAREAKNQLMNPSIGQVNPVIP